jgi:hypothetical protein
MELNEIVSGIAGSLAKSSDSIAKAFAGTLKLASHAAQHNDWTVMNKVLDSFRAYDETNNTSYTVDYLKWGEKHFGLVLDKDLFIGWSGSDAILSGAASAKAAPWHRKQKTVNNDVNLDFMDDLGKLLKKYNQVDLQKKIDRAHALGGEVNVNCPRDVLEAIHAIRYPAAEAA